MTDHLSDINSDQIYHSNKSRRTPAVCNVCNIIYSNLTLMKEHRKCHSLQNLSFCEVSKNFISKPSMIDHSRKHSKDKPSSCEKCDRKSPYKSKLREHKVTYSINVFICKICKLSFSLKLKLKAHYRVHIKEKPFKCDVCCKAFGHRKHLKIHRSEHSSNRLFVCDICKTGFNHKSVLQSHIKSHWSKKQFVCDFCAETFCTLTLKKLHQGKRKPIVCDECGDQFSCSSLLRDHLSEHSPKKSSIGEMPSTCFSNENLLKSSLTTKYIFTCKLCQKSFKNLTWFQKHYLVHSNDKASSIEIFSPSIGEKHESLISDITYMCDTCKQSFSYKFLLQQHFFTHPDHKPDQDKIDNDIAHVCDICEQSFDNKLLLQEHYWVHPVHKPDKCEINNNITYMCPECEHSFCYKFLLYEHYRIHPGHKPDKYEI